MKLGTQIRYAGKTIFFFSILFCHLAGQSVVAAPPKFQWFDDRFEGIEAGEPVSGALLSVISFKRKNNESSPGFPEKLRLVYGVPRGGKYEVMVHYPQCRYKMIRSLDRFQRYVACPTGLNKFEWDAGIVRQLKIGLPDLFCLITGPNGQLLPAELGGASEVAKPRSEVYSVTIIGNRDIKKLLFAISVGDGEKVLEEQEYVDLPKNIPFTIDFPDRSEFKTAGKLSFHTTFALENSVQTVEKKFELPPAK